MIRFAAIYFLLLIIISTNLGFEDPTSLTKIHLFVVAIVSLICIPGIEIKTAKDFYSFLVIIVVTPFILIWVIMS